MRYDVAAEEKNRRPLDAFFKPRTVVVIGASNTPGSVGHAIFWNLISNPFGGTVYAVNPKRHNVLGILAYPSVKALPEPIDLAMIVTPADTVPDVLDECIAVKVRGAIIISAGFSETGEAGRALEAQIREKARLGGIRIIGPNSLGLMNPQSGLNAAYAAQIAPKGSVGFISQSGALAAAVLDWSAEVNVGFSAFVSFGSMVDVGWSEVISYLGNDPNTRSIVVYMQSIGDARSFLSAAREVALSKPIIVLRAGETEKGAWIAEQTPYFSEPDQCSDEVISAAFRRSGVLRVYDMESLFSMAEVLGKQPRPRGPRLAILSNSAGPNILATDSLLKSGGELSTLSKHTMEELNALLPSYWNKDNPMDILADANDERYGESAEIVARDENTDGLLVILTPQVLSEPTKTAERLSTINFRGKPVLASWMGGAKVAEGDAILNEHNIPTLAYPDTAAKVFAAMWRYSYNIRGIYETPVLLPGNHVDPQQYKEAEEIIQTALTHQQPLLSEVASKRLLSSYGLPVIQTYTAHSEEEAVHLAEKLGYPVVLKLNYTPMSHTYSSSSAHMNLATPDAVRNAYRRLRETALEGLIPDDLQAITVRPMLLDEGYRIILGSMIDPQFGPVLFFGSGGPLGEVIRDRALALPPLNSTLARRLMEQTRCYNALCGRAGGRPADLAQLEQFLVRFSQLLVEQPWIREIDINPLLATHERLVILDARMLLHAPDTSPEQFPKLAIRPYPTEYTFPHTLKNGENLVLRAIRPEDEAMMVEFHQTLSDDTVYFRYMTRQNLDERIKHERLTRICFIDYDRQIGIVAEYTDPKTGAPRLLGVARLVRLFDESEAEFALVVSDPVQGQGLGEALLSTLIRIAKAEKLNRITGSILPDNRAMLQLCHKLGFTLEKPVGGEVIAVYSCTP